MEKRLRTPGGVERVDEASSWLNASLIGLVRSDSTVRAAVPPGGRALPSLFQVADRGIKTPAQGPVKVTDGHRKRASNAGRAVGIHSANRRDQSGQGADALRSFSGSTI